MPFPEVVVWDGRIGFVGSNENVVRYKDADTQIIDLNGKVMVSGFIDSHMHLLNLGLSMKTIDLSGARSIQQLKTMISEYIEHNNIKSGHWVLGRGWNQDYFEEKMFPNRYILDEISQQHPIVIVRACGHAIVANSKAIEACSINSFTKQVEGGSIDLDDKGSSMDFRENAIALIYE